MKFILMTMIIWCSLITGVSSKKIEPYTATGHEQFSSITLVSGGQLLINHGENNIKRDLKKLKRKFWGTETKLYMDYAKAKYVSTVIFSRSNRTREQYVFSYSLETVTYKDVSIEVKGSLSAKKVFKGKTGDLTANGDISLSYTSETYLKTTESGKMSIIIYPSKKVTLRVVGEAMVANGISKYYALGITTQKGAWEVVQVITACFELLEEDA